MGKKNKLKININKLIDGVDTFFYKGLLYLSKCLFTIIIIGLYTGIFAWGIYSMCKANIIENIMSTSLGLTLLFAVVLFYLAIYCDFIKYPLMLINIVNRINILKEQSGSTFVFNLTNNKISKNNKQLKIESLSIIVFFVLVVTIIIEAAIRHFITLF